MAYTLQKYAEGCAVYFRELRIRFGERTLSWCDTLCRVVASDDGVYQSTLSQEVGMKPSTIVRILQQLVDDGLVTSEICESNRRLRIIRPTPQCIELFSMLKEAEDMFRRD